MSSLPADTLARIPLPAKPQPVFGLDLQCRYYSARTGGDFFDTLTLGPHVVFLLTDIAGSRTDAHTVAAAIQDTFRRRAPEIFGTSGVNLMDAITTLALDINHTLTTVSHGPRFSPTFLACFDLPLGVLAYINAGGQVAILRDTDGTRVLQTASMPLGLFTHLTFEPAIQAFEPGAQLLLVTKGIIEAHRGRTHFGVERLIHMLESSTAVSAETLSQATVEEANQFRSRPWHLPRVSFMKPRQVEDLTAAVLLRPR